MNLVNRPREIGPTISNWAGSATIKFRPTVVRYLVRIEPSIPIMNAVKITPYTDMIRTIIGTIQIERAMIKLISFDLS